MSGGNGLNICKVMVATAGFLVAATLPAVSIAQTMPAPPSAGYGVAGVPGDTLAEMRANCAASRARGEKHGGMAARCEQLDRTQRNQPGNAASVSADPGHAR